MYNFLQKLKNSGHTCTLLGIGPVSKSVIKATFEAGLKYSFPPVFIASRNQVDLESLGHGYLMGGMDQFDFVSTLKKIQNDVGYEGPLYICRDHGGPWQRNMELDNKYSLEKAMEIAAAYNIGFKEHNGDYLGAADCSIHPEIGVTGVNVAPELGLVGTDAYLFLADLENQAAEQSLLTTGESSGLKNLLIEKTFKSSPWRKWLTHDLKELPAAEVEGNGSLRQLIARVCGHYVYDDPQVATARDQLFKNSRRFNLVENPEHFVIEKLLRAIGFYVKHFRMEGINRIAGRD